MPDLYAVTGAFGYTGRYIANRLLAQGDVRVMTLTGRPNRPNPFGDKVVVAPFNFDNPDALRKSLDGASVLINTYWVRFTRGKISHEMAVENTTRLFNAAKDAGVRKIVHISITSASSRSPLPYFRGKGVLEERLMALSVPYAIVRPTIVFSNEDILVNNIAWGLRRLPIFPIFGKGDYKSSLSTSRMSRRSPLTPPGSPATRS